MKSPKSEKLKKFETELEDLVQWLKLGLVPKSEIKKHEEEIELLKDRIEEEKNRLSSIKNNVSSDEYVVPKKSAQKPGFSDMPTLPDMDVGSSSQYTESDYTHSSDDTQYTESDEDKSGYSTESDATEDADDSYFSERSRWMRGARGGIVDPDADYL